ncbi:MAG: hypothetical protein BA863_04205 [Desulfovibrio sp. S3730MH75]|nr:MAG: hypothetical protein BA863_04205 [Desulfovibrio sp. S3730MH75]
MAFLPSFIETPQEMRTKTPDGKDMVFLSGYAVFNFKGSGSSWKRDDIWIPIGPEWNPLYDVVPVVSLASISNRHHAVNAGWAVDNCRWVTYNRRILLKCRVAIRDSDGYLQRLAYQATAIGRL